MDMWTTSVTQLLQVFRETLLALIPAMEAAHIPWKDGEAYDEWDEVSQCLYRNVVARSLHASHGRDVSLLDMLPPYNMNVQSYRNRGVLLASGPQINGAAVFVGLSSIDAPFDTVDCVCVDDAGDVVGEPVRQPFRDSVFSFATKPGLAHAVVTEFSVEL